MDSHASARIKSWLSRLCDGLNKFSNEVLLPAVCAVRLQSQNLQLSSTLASFGIRPRFFNIFFGVSDMNNDEHNDIPREKPQTLANIRRLCYYSMR